MRRLPFQRFALATCIMAGLGILVLGWVLYGVTLQSKTATRWGSHTLAVTSAVDREATRLLPEA